MPLVLPSTMYFLGERGSSALLVGFYNLRWGSCGLQGVPPGGLKRIILTASGGAFRDWPVEDLKKVRVGYESPWEQGAVPLAGLVSS
jgi:hypothetical protein